MKKRNYIYDFALGLAVIAIIFISAKGLNFKDNKEININEKMKAGAAPTVGHFTGLSFTVGNSYFDDVTHFPKIETYDGDYAGNASYCFDLTKDTPMSSVNYSTKSKAGYDVAYVVRNGYKGRTPTSLTDELQYYGTQLVIHKLSGVSLNDVTQHIDNLDAGTKADLIDYMNELIDGAAAYKANVQAGLTLNSGQSAYALNKVSGQNYYETSNIVVNSNTPGISIALSLSSAPSGAKIVNQSGTEISSVTAGGSYRIRVPAASLNNTTKTFTVNYSASRTVYYTYVYQPDDNRYQPVVLGETFDENQAGTGSVNITGQLEPEAPKYSLTITKQDGNGSNLAGATLRLERQDGSLIEQWNTSSSNPKTITGLEEGSYVLKETIIPTGYTGFADLTINVNETSQKTIIVNNTPVPEEDKGNVSILKTDGTNPLAGAKLRLEKTNGTLIEEWTSTTSAHVINDLQVGTYILKEVTAPSGYMVSESQTVQITKNNTTTVRFANELTSVKIIKTNGTSPLAGAKFQLLNSSNAVVKEWTTDATGEIVFTGLAAGTYTIKEVEAPEGYLPMGAVKQFTITANAPTPDITIVNSTTKVIINKINSSNNKPVSGATLEVRDASGNQVASWVSNGTSHEILSLPYGTYTIREKAAPNGFKLNEEEISFTLDDAHKTITLSFANDPIIEVPKTALNMSKTIINIGLLLIAIGGGLVYYNVKHPKNEQ